MVRAGDPAAEPVAAGDRLERLYASLTADVLLAHASGRKAIDLGYGSPEVTAWIRHRTGRHLSIVEKGALEADASSTPLREYAESDFDLAYCLRIFPHLGHDEESSERMARHVLEEAARVVRPGGIVAVEIANPRSLHGLRAGIRQPITVVARGTAMSSDESSLTRWETPGRLRELAPESLLPESIHGMGIFLPTRRLLQIPLLGRALEGLEWWGRDRPFLQHFGRRLLVLLRKERGPNATELRAAPVVVG